MSELLSKGTKVKVTMFDCTDTCGAPHAAVIIDVDPYDPTLPYEVEYTDDGHRTWAEFVEVTPA